jgi:hypothetical protein
MRRSDLTAFFLLITINSLLAVPSAASAQVVSPMEMKDPKLRDLQTQNMEDLKYVGQEIVSSSFDFPFYLSRKLDIDEKQQQGADQRSIRFDHYNGKTVLAITGNYYAAYSAEKMNNEQRARETFLHVAMPILKIVVPRFQSNKAVQGYALEISHHVLAKVMNVPVEHPENLVVFLPQSAALKLLSTKDENAQQAALLQGQTLLNAAPVSIWLNGQGPQVAASEPLEAPDAPENPSPHASAEILNVGDARGSDGHSRGAVPSFPKSPRVRETADPPQPVRDISPQALASLQGANKEVLGAIVKELDAQAHFVSYAAPSFVAFRQGIYLELSLNSALPEAAGGSRYKLAAYAFDEHVAHLVRPVLGYFKGEPQFDGISFSTNIHLPGKATSSSPSEAVEFFFPFSALRCYEKYDCTGQQLIDAGTVLINGERVSLDLQIAEGGSGR